MIEALLRKQSSFVRTPKYARRAAGATLEVAYRRKSGWLPFAEIAMGIGFLAIMCYCIDVMNFFALPFLLVFVCGYFWAGFSTLIQEYRDRLRTARSQVALQTAAH